MSWPDGDHPTYLDFGGNHHDLSLPEGEEAASEPKPLPAEVEALALRALQSRVEAALKLTKTEFGHAYPDGHKKTFRSPIDGRKLGMVHRTDPDPEWVVADSDALEAHLWTFPGNLVHYVDIADDAPFEEVLAVLAEHAPHLLKDVTSLRDGVIEAALEQSKATGEAAAPGIERRKPGGTLTVVPTRRRPPARSRV